MTTGNPNFRNYVLFPEYKQLNSIKSCLKSQLGTLLTDPNTKKGHRTYKIILQISIETQGLRENIQVECFSIGWFVQVSSYYGAVTGLLSLFYSKQASQTISPGKIKTVIKSVGPMPDGTLCRQIIIPSFLLKMNRPTLKRSWISHLYPEQMAYNT